MAGKKKNAEKHGVSETSQELHQPGKTTKPFPVVGIGASAGGLEALKSFFSAVPEDSGMAYIVVVHLSRTQPSMLPELLQKSTSIPVSAAVDDKVIEPHHIYIIPPNKDINVFKGRIQLFDVSQKAVPHPIDAFFRSLAQDQKKQAAAVVLSGTGTDGTLGLKEISGNEGVVLAQSEESAAYDGMPRSAISTGMVDMVLPPEKMPEKLRTYFISTEYINSSRPATPTSAGEQQKWLNKIFAILRTQTGHDFSAYKVNTILRRISRRMGLNEVDDKEVFVRYLRENPAEVENLFRELLIGVTNFFRDAPSFDVLKKTVLPSAIKKMAEGETFRVWIPGCSTGEEVYSLAIVLHELLESKRKRINLQLFGTDIDSFAIAKAREGLYPKTINADVSEERLKRFFIEEGDYFRIRKEIRDSVVFSTQDVIKDPPFSHLNLLCCRNLLIYLDTEMQRKLLPLFHYTLKPGGILVLGSSETVGAFSNLFKTLNNKWKIFSRLEVPVSLRQNVYFPSGSPSVENGGTVTNQSVPHPKSDLSRVTQMALLDNFAPTAVLVDAQGNILHIQGRTGKYLEAGSGPPSQNILDLAREGLRIELSSALREAKTSKKLVIRTKVSMRTNGDVQVIDLHVCPQHSPKELTGKFLVVFEDDETASASNTAAAEQGAQAQQAFEPSRVGDLEKELQFTRESHQTTIEELESSNEELKSTNEELQSSNEELQSTNEELESSKEELQSLNEELETVNAELQSKVNEMSSIRDDMQNLLNSTEIATIFVDNKLRVKRFTRKATKIVNLIQTDIGRPLQHVVTNLSYTGMISDVNGVLENLTPVETEVQSHDGKWYTMQIIPYRTMDNRIGGAVLNFQSIDQQIKTQHELEATSTKFESAWELVRAVFDMTAEPTVVMGDDGKVMIGNTRFAQMMKIKPEKLIGADILDARFGIPKSAKLASQLREALEQKIDFKTVPFFFNRAKSKQKWAVVGRIIKGESSFPYRILLTFVKEDQDEEKRV